MTRECLMDPVFPCRAHELGRRHIFRFQPPRLMIALAAADCKHWSARTPPVPDLPAVFCFRRQDALGRQPCILEDVARVSDIAFRAPRFGAEEL